MATGVYGQQSPITWVNGNTSTLTYNFNAARTEPNLTVGTATTALGGWPTQWDYSVITNHGTYTGTTTDGAIFTNGYAAGYNPSTSTLTNIAIVYGPGTNTLVASAPSGRQQTLTYGTNLPASGTTYTNLATSLPGVIVGSGIGTQLTAAAVNAAVGGTVATVPVNYGQVAVLSNVITLASLLPNSMASFTPTNGLDVYNNIQSIIIAGSGLWYNVVSPNFRIIQNYNYSGWCSSNLFVVNGYGFTASTNFLSLTTNNFVCTYGTLASYVNSIVASNQLFGLQYTTNSTPTGTYPAYYSFQGGVLLPDGRVFCVPFNSTTARIYNPATDTLSTPTGTYPGSNAFAGGVLLLDGRVFCVPNNSATARIASPASTNVFSPPVILGPTYNKY